MTIKEFAEVCICDVEIYRENESSMPIFRGDIEDFEDQDAIIEEIGATEFFPDCCGSSDDGYALIDIYLK